ncbi:MAG: hypothetical protein FJ125_10995 [Deltaproteobacteria bacterium]|nr:hypothetical protein [Deltaproteobacteria bacterium]
MYGDPVRPVWPGGGGHSFYSGSGCPAIGAAGGGVANVTVAGTLRVDGLIAANGGGGRIGICVAGDMGGGGGAGGSLLLEAGRLEGAGRITARGGSGGDGLNRDGGGGGGGRIAIHAQAVVLEPGQLSTRGGGSPAGADRRGGPGTAVIVTPESPHGDLLVDGEDVAGQATPLLDVGAGTVDEVFADGVGVIRVSFSTPGGQSLLAARKVRFGASADSPAFTILSHTASVLVLDADGQDLTGVLAPGQDFRGLYIFDDVTVSGGATVTVQDILRVTGTLTTTGGTLTAPRLEQP